MHVHDNSSQDTQSTIPLPAFVLALRAKALLLSSWVHIKTRDEVRNSAQRAGPRDTTRKNALVMGAYPESLLIGRLGHFLNLVGCK